MEFKTLDVTPEGNWLTRNLKSPHLRKTLIYILLGAVAGVLFTVFTADKTLAEFGTGELVQSALVGAFFGFFITNSPCARNQC
ncbi:hypothetical protein [uncultured Draconibacterium sp.]|uniref:hypothetical protein n=1 Tax=uncultured Draconibacterium sp. TaxID=1573823 RepID=UPI0025CBF718|nr:hypothetical protein [uncultured Draconibacterium sp.]